jgi:NAD(P)-dependent dehydrogenase (short-subunit alcohol dehydrogenase family)
MYEFTAQCALVTGGAQGIGFGISSELTRAGCQVIIANRNLPKAEAAAAELRAAGGSASALELDVTNDESVQRCVAEALKRCERIDILVNNAGIHCEHLERVSTIEHFERCFDVNLYGIWRMTQALVPHFKAQGGGKVVNIASINGRKPWVDTPAYSASKAAAINLTQSLASKLAAYNINVNAVCPGGVMTAMADFFWKDKLEEMRQKMIDTRPLKREMKPEDIGYAVVFLASSRARSITGQSLNVDCGMVMS